MLAASLHSKTAADGVDRRSTGRPRGRRGDAVDSGGSALRAARDARPDPGRECAAAADAALLPLRRAQSRPAPLARDDQRRERDFCCAGCLALAQTIHAAGLDAFYARRTEAADRAAAAAGAADDEWTHWDAPAAQAGLVRARRDGAAEVSLLLEGIHCGACIWLIESWLARQPGVAEASVNFATRRAHVVWDPARARLSDLLRAVARDRLSRVSVRSGAARGACAARIARRCCCAWPSRCWR